MSSIDISDLALKVMSMGVNKDQVFQLHWIQYFLPNDGRFYAQFKSLEKKVRVLPILLKPEQLNLYTPGSFYRNGLLLSDPPPLGQEESFTIESKERNDIVPVKRLISNDLYDLSTPFPHNFSLEQLCVVINDPMRQYIFPCFLIGATYYFRSASLRDSLLKRDLEALYDKKKGIELDNRHAQIHLNTFASNNDAPDIVRYVKDPLAEKHWDEITNVFRVLAKQGQNDPTRKIPFFADFPVSQRIEIKARVVKKMDPATGQETILVLDILEEDSVFPCDKITIFREGFTPKILNVTKRVKSYRTDRRVCNAAPSGNLQSVQILNKALASNPNKAKIIIEKKLLPHQERNVRKEIPLVVQGEDAVEISLEDPERSGDKEVRPGKVVSSDAATESAFEKNRLIFRDFNALLESFRNDERITNFEVHCEAPIPVRSGRGVRGSLREYYDKERTKTRRYLTASFFYIEASASVCLIEIDQSDLQSGFSTCVLISKHFGPEWPGYINEYLDFFVKNTVIEDIKKHFEENDIRYFGKKHPSVKLPDVTSWKTTLLNKILTY